MKSLGRVLDERILEVGMDAFGMSLDESHPRDESGARALADLGDRAVNDVANAVAQSAEHVFAFLEALRAELVCCPVNNWH